MHRRAGLIAVVTVALLAGCFRQGGVPETQAGASTPTPSSIMVEPSPSTVETQAAAPRPALCDGPEPPESSSFAYNRDAARRDSLLHFVSQLGGDHYTGGLASFDDLDAPGLARLIEAKFVDPYERQNLAPSVWEIFRFLCGHPGVRAMGYTISPDRPDYRVSIESIYAREVDAELREDAKVFCADTEAAEFVDHLECFWD